MPGLQPAIRAEFLKHCCERGMSLLRARRLDEAMAEFHDALRVDQAHAEALFGLGECMMLRGRIEDAIARYLECLQANPRHVPARFSLGNACLAKGKSNDAIKQFMMIQMADPGHVGARFGIGKSLEKKGQFSDALENYRGIVVAFPDYIDAYLAAARCLIEQGREKDAVKEYCNAISRAPGRLDIRETLIDLLARMGFYDDAIAEYRSILAELPGNPRRDIDIYLSIASLMDRGGSIGAAIDEYARILKMDPANSMAFNKHRLLLQEREKIDRLVHRYLGQAINRMEKIGGHFREGMKLYLDGSYSDALGEFNLELAEAPASEAHFAMGACIVRTGKLSSAVPHFKEAVRLNADFAEAHTMLGILYERFELLYEAYEEYARGVREARALASAEDGQSGRIDYRATGPSYRYYRLE